MTGVVGPVGGAAVVDTTGADLPLTGLTTPGHAWFYNSGRADGVTATAADYVQVGLHDGSVFHPVWELLPGKAPAKFMFARDFGEENTVPGTGTTGTVNTLYAKAFGATQVLQYAVFDR